MITTNDLKKILKDNNIKFYSHWTKKKFVDVVKEHGLYPEEIKPVEKKKNVHSAESDRLQSILKNPRKVEVEDVETGEIINFPSVYKAGKFIDKCPQTIENWNGKVWNGKYKFNIL